MYLKVIVQNSENGDVYNITNIVSNIQISTQIYNQAGKITFLTQRQEENDYSNIAIFEEGSRIQVTWKEKGIFFGYIFKRETDKHGTIKITAYDQLRYLKNKDMHINKGETLAATFKKFCEVFNLKYKIAEDSGYIVPPKIFSDTNIYEILKYSIDANIQGVKKQYIIYDDFGTLTLNNIENLKTDYIFSDVSMITDYRYNRSIDNNTYNQIKLVRENKDEHIHYTFITKDSDNQKRWGILQYFKKVNEQAGDGIIQEWGKNLLNIYNVVEEKLNINALALNNDDDIWNVKAGTGIMIAVNTALGNIGNEMYLINRCTHSLKNENYHTLSLEVIKLSPTKQQGA